MRWKGLNSDRWDTTFAWKPRKCFQCHDWIWLEKIVVWKQYDKWQCQVCYVTTSIGGEKAWNPYEILNQKPFLPTPVPPPQPYSPTPWPYPGASGGTTLTYPQPLPKELSGYWEKSSGVGSYQNTSGYETSSQAQSSPTD